jgi:hypothetical protein
MVCLYKQPKGQKSAQKLCSKFQKQDQKSAVSLFNFGSLAPQCNVENLLISHSDKVNDEISTWVLNCSQASIIHVLKLEADFLAKSTLDTTKKIREREGFFLFLKIAQ